MERKTNVCIKRLWPHAYIYSCSDTIAARNREWKSALHWEPERIRSDSKCVTQARWISAGAMDALLRAVAGSTSGIAANGLARVQLCRLRELIKSKHCLPKYSSSLRMQHFYGCIIFIVMPGAMPGSKPIWQQPVPIGKAPTTVLFETAASH